MKPRTERTDCHPDSGRRASSIILLREDADRARASSRRKGGSTSGSRPKRPPVRPGAIMTALVHLDPEPYVVVEGADGTEHVRVSNGAGSLYWHGRSYWLRWPVTDPECEPRVLGLRQINRSESDETCNDDSPDLDGCMLSCDTAAGDGDHQG